MTTAVRTLLCTTFLAGTLAACGGGGGGDTSPSGSSGSGDVEIAKLNGTWGGSFDANNQVQGMQISIDTSNTSDVKITDIKLNGTSVGLVGTVTKANDAPRTFRFVLKDPNDTSGTPVSQGALLVDSAAKYLVYLDEFMEVGVTQKGADGLPSGGYSQADINATWSGDALTTAGVNPSPAGDGFGQFTHTDASVKCDPAAAGSPGGPSSCDVTVGSTHRTAASVTLGDASGGRWSGTYTETPDSGTGTDKVFRMNLSPDKKYAGALTCATAGSFPTCTFYSWKHN